MNSSQIEKLLEATKQGEFSLDCVSMSLQPKWDNSLEALTGSGEIRQDSSRKLILKMFASHAPPRYPTKAGQLVPHEAYFRLTATDVNGKDWRCDFVLPSVRYVDDHHKCVLTARIWQVEHFCTRRTKRQVAQVAFTTFDNVNVPTNAETTTETTSPKGKVTASVANIAEGRCSGLDFIMENLAPGLRVNAYGSQHGLALEVRVAEALRFVLAKPFQWHFLYEHGNSVERVQIRSEYSTMSHTRLFPPIKMSGGIDLHGGFFPLFSSYLEYILRKTEDSNEWHPLSHHLYSACEGSAGSVAQQCLALAVATEGALSIAFPQTDERTMQLEHAVASLKSHFGAWESRSIFGIINRPDEERLRRRLDGLLGSLLQEGANQRLREVAEAGWVSMDEVKAWKRVRDPAAHARTPEGRVSQRTLDDVSAVTTLLYKLVFAAIDYKGRYSNYSIDGWPVSEFNRPGSTTQC